MNNAYLLHARKAAQLELSELVKKIEAWKFENCHLFDNEEAVKLVEEALKSLK